MKIGFVILLQNWKYISIFSIISYNQLIWLSFTWLAEWLIISILLLKSDKQLKKKKRILISRN